MARAPILSGLVGTPSIRSRRRAWAYVLLAVLLCAQSSNAPKPVEFVHFKQYIFDTDGIAFDVRILPNAQYRLLRVAAMNDLGYAERSSDVQLEGDVSAAVWRIEWYPIGTGHYSVIARTYDESGAQCARTAEYWGSCKSLASATSNLEVRGFSAVYSPFDDPQ